MLGFDLGLIGNSSTMDLYVYTNLTSYNYALNVPNVASRPGSNFYGGVLNGGEYFTGINIISSGGSGSGAALDNMRLGHMGNVIPEPATLSLLGLGLLGLVFKKK